MAFRTPGIGGTGNGLPVATLTVLAYQHFTVLAIYCQKLFATSWTNLICQIVMTEGSLSRLNLVYDLAGIITDFVQEISLADPAFGNIAFLSL